MRFLAVNVARHGRGYQAVTGRRQTASMTTTFGRIAFGAILGIASIVAAPGPAMTEEQRKTITVIMTTPSPTPVPPGPTPTPSPTPSPGPFLRFDRSDAGSARTLFAFAVSSDAPTAARVAAELATAVRPELAPGLWIVPQPTWQLADFINQCRYQPEATLGALIAYAPVLENGSDNYLLFTTNWTHLEMSVVAARCAPPDKDPTTGGTAYAMWTLSTSPGGVGRRASISLLPLAAVAATIYALGGRRSSTETKATTIAYASPVPAPAPGATFTTQLVDTTASNNNLNNDTNLAAVTLLGQLAGPNSTSLGALSATDAQTATAARKAMAALLAQVRSFDCATGSAQAPARFCDWFKKR
jgi:hypothetical protein